MKKCLMTAVLVFICTAAEAKTHCAITLLNNGVLMNAKTSGTVCVRGNNVKLVNLNLSGYTAKTKAISQ